MNTKTKVIAAVIAILFGIVLGLTQGDDKEYSKKA